ncbi:MAG: hypothetical protein BWY26_00695 [Elusimicrobia bacterium ADurb.Bin231]|nr:MAG: hypothetical protein BWY26_00695 [Elusimicrobia bacterium ADurb.Bin231]
MKNLFKFLRGGVVLLLAHLFVLPVFLLSQELKIIPYYSLGVVEGAFIPNKGDWNFSVNLLSDLGVMVKPSEIHSFIGFYELKYTGPGLKRQEGEKFTDRTMDHLVSLRHNFLISDSYFLKSQINYMKEYKRTGSNEPWGTGLYDFDRMGGMISVGRKFSDLTVLSLTGQYHTMKFPNYTDLLAEFQAGSGSAESSAGKQNHNIIQAGVSLDVDTNKLAFDIILMNYTKQHIAEATLSAGSYYGSDLQKDIIYNVSARRIQKVGETFTIAPEVAYKVKSSNQNYLHFESFGSTTPPVYFDDYYSYNEFAFFVPAAIALSKRFEFSVTPEWDYKLYKNRNPRNTDGVFLTNEKQSNNMFILDTGLCFKPNDVTRTTLFYVFQNQKSNMKYERYLPYNYTGNYMGIKFEYTF